MLLLIIGLLFITLFLLVMRFVQPELIYSLRHGLVLVRANKAFIDKQADRDGVGQTFRELLMHEARYETRTDDASYILKDRILKIGELYRLMDLRRDLARNQRPQVCIVELGGLLINLGRSLEASVEHNHPIIKASALLGYIGNGIRASQSEASFAGEAEIDNWFIENPISIEQVTEIMIAAVVGLAHRQQAAKTPAPGQQEVILNPWPEINKLEKKLRLFIRSQFQKKYKTNEDIHSRMREILGEKNYEKCLQAMERARTKTPNISLDFLDFLYLRQLQTMILNEWDVFGEVFPEKAWLANKFDKIIQVRNEEAHSRRVSAADRMLLVGYCSEIKSRIENFEAGNV